jgi:Flp pilus assembly protein TadD
MSLSQDEKGRIAHALVRVKRSQVLSLLGSFEDEIDNWEHRFRCKVTVQRLRSAFAHGYMAHLKDLAAAEAAALALDAPGISATVLAARLEQAFEPDGFEAVVGLSRKVPSAFALRVLGDVLSKQFRRYEEAEAAYRKAIEVDPQYAYAWVRLGDLLRKQLARLAEAEAAYRTAIEIDPRHAVAWIRLGIVLHDRGRLADAEATYRKAIELDPQYAFAWNRLGRVLRDLARLTEAEVAYRKAVAVDPQYAFAWSRLGVVLDDLGRFAEAESAYRRATDLDPTNGRYWNSLAWCCYQNHDLELATEDAARRAVELTPSSPHAVHTLATVLAARDNWSEAEPFARRFLTEGSPNFHDHRWPDLLLFFREAARTGHAADAVRLLDDLALTDRFRPLREALAAVAAGSKLPLRRIAPEIRRPAEELLDVLWPEGLE